MLTAVAVTLWFFCGLMAIHLAFAAARSRQDLFDPIHVWLALLGPIALVLACFTRAEASQDESPVHSTGK
jgi:hypothetical protein